MTYNSTNSAATNYAVNVQAPLNVFTQTIGKPRPQLAKYTFKFDTAYQLAGLSDNKFLKNMAVGTSVRWVGQAAIGYYGLQTLPATITQLDPNRPIFTPAQTYVDVFVSYKTRLFHDKIGATFQLNAKKPSREVAIACSLRRLSPKRNSPRLSAIVDPRQ